MEDLKTLKNLKEALDCYIKTYTINGKYVGNPKYLEDYERISMYLEGRYGGKETLWSR